jgi:hypothetical protein
MDAQKVNLILVKIQIAREFMERQAAFVFQVMSIHIAKNVSHLFLWVI